MVTRNGFAMKNYLENGSRKIAGLGKRREEILN